MRASKLIRENMRPDTKEAIAERIRYRAASQQASAEMLERFAPLTVDNALEAVAWQQARIAELMKVKS